MAHATRRTSLTAPVHSRVLERWGAQGPIPRGQALPTERVAWIRMGTTVATNGLLERKGARVLFVTTKGFKDLLRIGDQTRANIFDLRHRKPGQRIALGGQAVHRLRLQAAEVLHERVVELDHRMCVDGDGNVRVESEVRPIHALSPPAHTLSSSQPNWDALRADMQDAFTAGIRSVAVCLLHSYLRADHEQAVARLARELGFTQVRSRRVYVGPG